MKLRLISVLMVVTLALAMVLSGCGSSKDTGTSSNTTVNGSTAPTVEPAKPVTLKMLQHSNQASNDAVKVLDQKFHEKYPNITIDDSAIIETAQYNQVMQTRIAASDVDILEFTCFNIETPEWAKGLTPSANLQYIQNGDILDITGQPFLSNWPKTTIDDSMSYDGKVYNVTTGKNAYNGLFYNKEIFEKYGLSVPNTWSEFINICKTLQSKGIAPITSGAKDVWPLGMIWNGFVNANEPDVAAFAKGVWTGERKWNDPKTEALFEKMAEFASYLEKGVTSVDYASVIGRFVSGKAAMMQDGSWQGANITAADPNFKFGYFALPGDNAGSEPMQLAGKYEYGFAGAAKTGHKDGVLQWFDFFSQEGVYAEFVNSCGFLPAMDDVQVTNEFINSLAPINKNFQKNFGEVQRVPQGLGKYGNFSIANLKVLGGTVATAKELADLSQKDWETALAAIQK